MKDELQSKMVEILSSIQTATGQAKDFALEQLPDVALSYVAYGRLYLTSLAMAGLLVCSVGAFVALRHGFLNTAGVINNPDSWRDGDWTEGRSISAVVGSAATVLGLFLLVANLSEALMVWVAPKIWLLKQLATMVR